MGNCITAPFRGNYRNRSGTHAAGRDATGGGARVGADVSTGGRGSVGAGPGLGWLGLGLGRRRRAQARWQGARMRQAGQARAAGRKARSAMPRAACRCRMAQGPFGRTAGRCRGKAARRWQHLRAMRDFGLLDAKKGPWRQDSRAMYPKSPDCTREWMHRARMLPFRSRRACISGGCCQEGGLFRAFGEKGMHTARFLPARALGPPQREEGDGGDAGGGARWARCGRRSATRVRRRRTMVVMGGAMSAGSARWRHRGMRMAARSGVDAMRATACGGRDADEASPMGAGGSGAVLR